MVVDARGMLCPWPAIRLARAIREGASGEIEVLADDPKAAGELAEVAAAAGWTFESGVGLFRVRRAA
ncbi:sulfurtransferase TusA family protein [Sphingomonas gilva]|uniref:Sulfurtransferase TusA family protein n=1 Tax=Sphingomonas gilva TaxID=2305907 RepID=A0A396RUJ2_9SPHN|nr:sulfurtransferase TusA family protein [Sphingomonas gilva]RHW18083.1 sulfurtransferase TusA family protein [Sphingomonas gilva]